MAIFSIDEMIKIRAMLEAINTSDDPLMADVIDHIIKIYGPHRPDLHVEIAKGRLLVRIRDEQIKLPLDGEKKGDGHA